MRMGVVADDITGANDIGIMFAKAGYVTHVYPYGGPGALASAPRLDEAEICILDTNSRFDAPRDAYQKAFAATRELQALGCDHFHNKTCSVFRGNIGSEFDAMLDALGESFAVVVLGFPKNGRVTLDGIHYVHGKRLEESEFRRDPMHPMRQSNLVDILQSQTARRVALLTHDVVEQGAEVLCARIEEMRARCHYLILDVADQQALRTIASAVRDCRVLCGSSALAEELPGVWSTPPAPAQPVALPLSTGAGVFCVAGSLTPQTTAQIQHLRQRGIPVWELDTLALLQPGEREREKARLVEALARELRSGVDLLLHASNDPDTVEKTYAAGEGQGMSRRAVARLVSGALADLAARTVARSGTNRLIVAGGDTSAAVCDRLGVRGMRVWQEIQPGLPTCLSLTGSPLLLVLKSGSFGNPGFLEQAIDHLKGQTRKELSMATPSLSEVAAILRDHFGERIVGTRIAGIDLMEEVLQDRLGLSHEEAKELVESLERAHAIEWVGGPHLAGTVAQATMPFAEALGAESPPGPATSAVVPLDDGYWQL